MSDRDRRWMGRLDGEEGVASGRKGEKTDGEQ